MVNALEKSKVNLKFYIEFSQAFLSLEAKRSELVYARDEGIQRWCQVAGLGFNGVQGLKCSQPCAKCSP
jgi:hypothetical protein